MYYVVYGFLWLLSLLPLPVLYLLSDFFYGLVFYVFKYRRNIVMNNLAIAFPEKTIAERTKIAKRFYKNFIDSFIETIKLFSAGKRFVERRASSNFAVFDELARKGYSVNIMCGHQFNWELGNHLYAMHLKVPFVGIYMPITNQVLDRVFINLRKRYGTILISAKDFKSKVHTIFDRQHCFGLAADQNPGNPSNSFWMDFFGKPVPWVTGPSKGAVRNNAAVVFVAMKKPKRGHYHFEPTLLAERASEYTPQQLTKIYKEALEKTIREEPDNYLWSHRRWKWQWKEEYGVKY
ncbi:MAG TPA: lysophospholipid acyltransferase family protein [Chitinophagaceae bacterium]